MILYGAAAEQSIPKLFIAGVVPGLLIAVLMGIYISTSAWMSNLPTDDRFEVREAAIAVRQSLAALSMPILVLVGIYTGAFSPSEAGGFACLYSAALGLFIYRSLTLRIIVDAAIRAAMTTSQIMIVVAAASVVSWILTVEGVPQALTSGATAAGVSQLGFLLAVNALLLIIGCFSTRHRRSWSLRRFWCQSP